MLRFVGAPMLGNKTQKARSILGHIQSQRARGEAELAKANFKIQVYRAAAAGEAVPEEAFERFGVPRSSIRLKEIKAELPAFLSPENATAAPQFNETATNLMLPSTLARKSSDLEGPIRFISITSLAESDNAAASHNNRPAFV